MGRSNPASVKIKHNESIIYCALAGIKSEARPSPSKAYGFSIRNIQTMA
jgi:hypothetical protein